MQKQFSREKKPFQQMVLENLSIHAKQKNQKTKTPTCYIQFNSKWIMNLHIKHKTIKLLERTGENLQDLEAVKEFLDNTTSMMHRRKN